MTNSPPFFRLGKGSFATVVKALHRPTGQYFAVKVIPRPKSLLQPNTVKMLEREMAILRQLDHVSFPLLKAPIVDR
jgi:serine/threonine/tyrosine protein kinase RAD53